MATHSSVLAWRIPGTGESGGLLSMGLHRVGHDWSDSAAYFIYPVVAQTVKRLPAVRETQVRSLGWEDPLEKEMPTHSRTLAWKIPWTEEPGRLQSMGSQRLGHDWATHTHTHIIALQCCVPPGVEPASAALQVDSLPTELLGKPIVFLYFSNKNILFCGPPITDKLLFSIIYMCFFPQYFNHYKISL